MKFDFQGRQRNDGAGYNPAKVSINFKRKLSDYPDEDAGIRQNKQFPTSSEMNDTSTSNSGDMYDEGASASKA